MDKYNNVKSSPLEPADRTRINLLFTKIRRRFFYNRLLDSIMTGLFFAELGGILFFVGFSLSHQFNISLPFYFVMTIFTGITGGMVSVIFSNSDKYEAEKRIDQTYSLDDRFLTLTELLSKSDIHKINDIAKLQIEDCLTCLPGINPAQVAPIKIPRAWTQVVCLFMIMLFVSFFLIQSPSEAEAQTPNQTVVEVIQDLEQNLRVSLKAMIRDNPDHEALRELDRKTVQILNVLEESKDDPRKSLAVLSQMEQEIRRTVEAFNIEATDLAFKDIANALLNCDSTKMAAAALLEEDYDKAAQELEQIDFDSLSRNDRLTLSQKLKNAAETIRQRKQNQLAQLADQLAEELQESKCASCKNTSCKLAGQCRTQKTNKLLAQKLNCQLARLGLCKANCAGACASCENNCPSKESKTESSKTGTSSGAQPGTDAASNPLSGIENDLNTSRQQQLLKGIQNDEGISTQEIIRSNQHKKEKSTTLTSETYNAYKKQMESVLENEEIPLDQRHVIRTYFESIRPQNEMEK